MAGNATAQNAVLAALAEAGRCTSLEDIAATTGLLRRHLSGTAKLLIDRGLIVRRERGCYEITPEGVALRDSGVELASGPKGPFAQPRGVRNCLRARLWRAIRIKQKFTLDDLLLLATTGDEQNARGNAQVYLRMLAQAGYLTELRRAHANCPKRYSVVRDTGPLMPLYRRGSRVIYDQNTKVEYACGSGGDA